MKGEAAPISTPKSKQKFMRISMKPWSMRKAPLNSFEKEKSYLKCMPIEVMAKRGIKTMLYGPMKPQSVLSIRTTTGPNVMEFKTPYALLCNFVRIMKLGLYNIELFQKPTKNRENKRVFQMNPEVENARSMSDGVMHRNSLMDSPNLLEQTYRSKRKPNLFSYGQI